MDLYLISVLIFIAFLAVWVYKDRRKFTRQSIFLLRKTKRGRELITRVGTRFPKGWKYVGFVSVVTGFIVSVLGLNKLLDNAVMALTTSEVAPS